MNFVLVRLPLPLQTQSEWWGAGVVICLERGADLHMSQLMPLPLTVSCFSKIQIGLPFWYRLTWVVPEKGPLNGCVCVFLQTQSKSANCGPCRQTRRNEDGECEPVLSIAACKLVNVVITGLLRYDQNCRITTYHTHTHAHTLLLLLFFFYTPGSIDPRGWKLEAKTNITGG